MLEFLLGYIVGSASSQSSTPPTPMSAEEAVFWTAFILIGGVVFLVWCLRSAKRGL